MNSLALYTILIQQLSEQPDLSIVQDRQLIPEHWPVILTEILSFRKQIQGFVVSDGKHQVVCVSSLPEVYERVSSLELGTIIHLIDPELRQDEPNRRYNIDVKDICTLKEFDERLKNQQLEAKRAEEERLAWLREQGFLDELDELNEDDSPSASSESDVLIENALS
ncbi:MAG: hypothetical protein K2X01_05350 [Cyanobacteria bacterium]|nr:hypothetical protein [Cyanobacteriota bacterium]